MINIAKTIEMVEEKNLSIELTVIEVIEKTFQPSWEPDRFPGASSSSSSCPIPAPENLLLYMSLKVLKIC